MADVVVIGIGNSYRSDDGVGPRTVDALREVVPDGVGLVRSDGDPDSLMQAWEPADLAVVVDAVVSGGKPGTIYRFNGRDRLPAAFFSTSTHAFGLSEAIELGHALHRLPGELQIVGVEAGSLAHGRGLTPPVRSALPRVVDVVQSLITPTLLERTHA